MSHHLQCDKDSLSFPLFWGNKFAHLVYCQFFHITYTYTAIFDLMCFHTVTVSLSLLSHHQITSSYGSWYALIAWLRGWFVVQFTATSKVQDRVLPLWVKSGKKQHRWALRETHTFADHNGALLGELRLNMLSQVLYVAFRAGSLSTTWSKVSSGCPTSQQDKHTHTWLTRVITLNFPDCYRSESRSQ